MAYRTKTYIAADWTGDRDAIDKLYEWNDSSYLTLSFVNAHDLTSARDDSLNCSIKASLATRLDASKHSSLLWAMIRNHFVLAAANTVTA